MINIENKYFTKDWSKIQSHKFKRKERTSLNPIKLAKKFFWSEDKLINAAKFLDFVINNIN